jgi:pimeloyl-ACP methyl ester carboxylesterase
MLLDVQRFDSFDGSELAYEVRGDGPPVVLLHGFASDSFLNWERPGVLDKITAAGFRAIALDQRGHGSSAKPHDPDAYGDGAMVRDAQALIEHLDLGRVLCVGYSMGARTTLELVTRDDRVRAAVLGGIGANMLRSREWGGAVADAMTVGDKRQVTDRFARSFRDFADLTGADREALAAIQRNPRPPLQGLDGISIPVLVLCGDNDPLVGDPAGLAEVIPGAEVVVVGGTHLNVVNNPQFQDALLGFLEKNREAVT